MTIANNSMSSYNVKLDLDKDKLAANCSNFKDFDGHVVRRASRVQILTCTNFSEKNNVSLLMKYVSYYEDVEFEIGKCDVDFFNNWSMSKEIKSEGVAVVFIEIPASACIGTYHLSVKIDEEDIISSKLYVICNPWNAEDETFIDDEILREEYVLNSDTIIYVGTRYQQSPKFWDLSLDDPKCIEAAFKVLDQTYLKNKRSIKSVSRELAAMVNSNDDWGILKGNWSGEYSDGHSPSSWSNSKEILRKWIKYSRPVKYGQCFNFGAILATLCRILGIGCRIISNFSSHHDTDGTLNYELYYDQNNEFLDISTESVWNFHVWNECFFKRYDMDEQYSGWQVIDGTPQERSNGRFTLGPASKMAIIKGNVAYEYDTAFVFAEVNADMVYLTSDSNSSDQKKVLKIESDKIGLNISTIDPYDWQRLDITNTYKFIDQKDRRASKQNASTKVERQYDLDASDSDCTITIDSPNGIQINENLSFTLSTAPTESLIESSRGTSSPVPGKLLYAVYLVDSRDKMIARIETNKLDIDNICEDFVQEVTIKRSDICKILRCEFPIIKIVALVMRTDNGKTCDLEFKPVNVTTPNIEIFVPPEIHLNVPFEVDIKFINTLDTEIPSGKLYLEGPSMTKRKGVRFDKLSPGEIFSFSHTTEIKKDTRKHYFIGSLDCSKYPCLSDKVEFSLSE